MHALIDLVFEKQVDGAGEIKSKAGLFELALSFSTGEVGGNQT